MSSSFYCDRFEIEYIMYDHPVSVSEHEYMDELQPYYCRPDITTCQRNRWIRDDENSNCRG